MKSDFCFAVMVERFNDAAIRLRGLPLVTLAQHVL